MSKINHHNNFYEKFNSERIVSIKARNRIKKTIDLIPNDIDSLLEVGCGDGRIINQLVGKYNKICGLDISHNALKHVKTEKVQGRIENLPFEDNSFDLVLCCEVLEHLPDDIYQDALKEIQRVSNEYILITVPNNENLDFQMVKCPECGVSSHRYGHLRSFDTNNLFSLLEDFEIINIKTFLTDQIILNGFIFKLLNTFNLSKSQFQKGESCYWCGYSPDTEVSKNVPSADKNSKLTKIKKYIPTKKSGGWEMVLYKKV